MIEDEEEQYLGLGYRKKSEDKLTYKNIIAEAIRKCLFTKGSTYFKEAVEGLEKAIYFDVTGYKLMTEINKIKKELEVGKYKIIRKMKRKLGVDFYGNKEQVELKIQVRKWYWETLFTRLIQLLADNNLLFETEKVTPIKIKKPEFREGELGIPEGPTESPYDE